MEEKKYRVYAEEFKLQALEMLKQGEKSGSEIERDLGITPGLLNKWRARYQATKKTDQKSSLIASDLEAAKAEIRRLQRELAAVEEERDILKKALHIFSRKSV